MLHRNYFVILLRYLYIVTLASYFIYQAFIRVMNFYYCLAFKPHIALTKTFCGMFYIMFHNWKLLYNLHYILCSFICIYFILHNIISIKIYNMWLLLLLYITYRTLRTRIALLSPASSMVEGLLHISCPVSLCRSRHPSHFVWHLSLTLFCHFQIYFFLLKGLD